MREDDRSDADPVPQQRHEGDGAEFTGALRPAGVVGRVWSRCICDFNDSSFLDCPGRRAVLDIERKGINRSYTFDCFDRATQ